MLSNSFSLNGQIAFITGGGSDIGQSVAQCMAAAGSRVVVCGRREQALENTCRRIGGSVSTLAAHPDDPPMKTMRLQPRLVYQPQLYDRLISVNPSRANKLEFCIGTLAEMSKAISIKL